MKTQKKRISKKELAKFIDSVVDEFQSLSSDMISDFIIKKFNLDYSCRDLLILTISETVDRIKCLEAEDIATDILKTDIF